MAIKRAKTDNITIKGEKKDPTGYDAKQEKRRALAERLKGNAAAASGSGKKSKGKKTA
jgi:hypothetical protein